VRISALCRTVPAPHDVIRVDQRFFPPILELAGAVYISRDGAMDVSGRSALRQPLGRDFAPCA